MGAAFKRVLPSIVLHHTQMALFTLACVMWMFAICAEIPFLMQRLRLSKLHHVFLTIDQLPFEFLSSRFRTLVCF
jgi:hypothetical protein